MEEIMDNEESSAADPERLIMMLSDRDGSYRQKARETLVDMGKPAVPSLIRALQDAGNYQVRWEAAKALGTLCDIRSIAQLVLALEDNDEDVAWLAAEALIKFKRDAWPLLLEALINRRSPVVLYEGAHHILSGPKKENQSILDVLVKTLESGTIPGAVRIAADDVLRKIAVKPWK
jgi:hypothetical protein